MTIASDFKLNCVYCACVSFFLLSKIVAEKQKIEPTEKSMSKDSAQTQAKARETLMPVMISHSSMFSQTN